MRESTESKIIKITNLADLDKVKPSWMFPTSPYPLALGGRGRGGRGRGSRTETAAVGTRLSSQKIQLNS